MKRLPFLLLVLALFTSSCTTLNVSDLQNLERASFEPLQLRPEVEPNNLRIDVIRQTEEFMENDTTVETLNTPYHPLGFYLGNGLFYDLNENLSLRVDDLLNAPSDGFDIVQINRPEKNKRVVEYSFAADTLWVKYRPNRRPVYQYHQVSSPGRVSFVRNRRMLYAIDETGSSLAYYRGKRRWRDSIAQTGENSFYLKTRWGKRYFEQSGDKLALGREFQVVLANDGKAIYIKRGKKGRRLLYTIERGPGRIFIYDRRNRGKMIVFEEKSILVYSNADLLRRYELK